MSVPNMSLIEAIAVVLAFKDRRFLTERETMTLARAQAIVNEAARITVERPPVTVADISIGNGRD